MTLKERFGRVLDIFSEKMPEVATELNYGNNFELLVAVILSAQCTDKRVNLTTPALFEAFPTPEAMAKAPVEDILQFIKSISYPNNKAKLLSAAARKLVDEFDGKIPEDADSLLSLPGVGRKTANVMLAVAFDRPAMPVDTHVFRVSERIGLTTNSKSPLETERRLVKYIPGELLSKAHHWLILHGRYVCKARTPLCAECFLSNVCRYHAKQQ